MIWYPHELSRLHNLQAWYWNSLLYGHISSGENSVHFLQLMPFTTLQFSLHKVPITAGWAEAVWNKKSAQYFYRWPAVKTSDLESNTAPTGPHARNVMLWFAQLCCYTVLCYHILCYTTLGIFFIMLCNAILFYYILCCAVFCYAIQCYAMLHVMLCCAMLCYMLCSAMLYYIMQICSERISYLKVVHCGTSNCYIWAHIMNSCNRNTTNSVQWEQW